MFATLVANCLIQDCRMPSASKSSTIPLVCILCPGSKRFSDLSHLLTHLNSKGHLQSKHKLELRVAIDQSAQDTLDSFAAWYSENNFAELLSERLNPKPKKTGVRSTKNKRNCAQVVVNSLFGNISLSPDSRTKTIQMQTAYQLLLQRTPTEPLCLKCKM